MVIRNRHALHKPLNLLHKIDSILRVCANIDEWNALVLKQPTEG